MKLVKKKVLIISCMSAAIVAVSGFLIYKAISGHWMPSGKSEYLQEANSLSKKKNLEQSAKYADNYNKRVKNLDDLRTPKKGSVAPDPSKVAKSESNNTDTIQLYTLFQNKLLNTDQYISAKKKLSLGIQLISKISSISDSNNDLNNYFEQNKDNIKTLYGITSYSDFDKLKNKFNSLTSNCKANLDTSSIQSDQNSIYFYIAITDANNHMKTEYITLTYVNDVEMSVSWKI